MSGLTSSEESMLMSNGFSVNDMQDIGGGSSGAFEGKHKISDISFIVNMIHFKFILNDSINYEFIIFIPQFNQMKAFTHLLCKAILR